MILPDNGGPRTIRIQLCSGGRGLQGSSQQGVIVGLRAVPLRVASPADASFIARGDFQLRLRLICIFEIIVLLFSTCARGVLFKTSKLGIASLRAETLKASKLASL